jgi:hypothetical protein
MWPFRKKTREEKLDEIKETVFEIFRTMRETGNYNPSLVRGVLNMIDQIDRLEKQWDEEREFKKRYYHK